MWRLYMQTPLELTLKGFMDTDGTIEALVQEKLIKLEQVSPRLTSCSVAIEQLNNNQKHDHTYHIRIHLMLPNHHEIVIKHDPEKGVMEHKKLGTILRETFATARRQAKEITDKQRHKVKNHHQELSDV